jgi:hypothetical protein
MGDTRGVYRVLMGRPERRRPLERLRNRREDNNIKMDLQDILWESWTGLICLRIETGGRLF